MIMGECFVIKLDLKNAKKKCLYGKVCQYMVNKKREARLFFGLKT
jgi:hypothetical protein